MNKTLLATLATGLIFLTGCSKNEEPSTANPAPEIPAIEPAQTATKSVTEKALEISTQVSEQVATLSKKTDDVIALTHVAPEDVMEELNLPLETLNAKIASYNPSELISRAKAYQAIFMDYKAKYDAIGSQIKNMPLGNAFTEQGKAIKDKLAEYNSKLGALKERYTLYTNTLKELGFNLNVLDLP